MKQWFTMSLSLIALASLCIATPITSNAQADKPIELFNGKDLTGWEGQGQNNQWLVVGDVQLGSKDKSAFAMERGEGIMTNSLQGRTVNLFTDDQHGDCRLHIEFVVPNGSNSGVYFQGLYEIQVFDSYGKGVVEHSDCGGIYQRYVEGEGRGYEGHPPRVNASNAPGVWQSYDIVFRAPRFDASGKKTENAKFIQVAHNGVTVHENVEVTGGTRAHMDRDEAPLGPLMLQGDHGPVAYRNIRMTPLKLK
ncbi:MAG: DUF1080 domain-containing protein [Candidatus Hinthialibacter antarcticus]|nr:DUF1080 domain-containing protein [Candidatus Hinthialibacter antarcticus]